MIKSVEIHNFYNTFLLWSLSTINICACKTEEDEILFVKMIAFLNYCVTTKDYSWYTDYITNENVFIYKAQALDYEYVLIMQQDCKIISQELYQNGSKLKGNFDLPEDLNSVFNDVIILDLENYEQINKVLMTNVETLDKTSFRMFLLELYAACNTSISDIKVNAEENNVEFYLIDDNTTYYFTDLDENYQFLYKIGFVIFSGLVTAGTIIIRKVQTVEYDFFITFVDALMTTIKDMKNDKFQVIFTAYGDNLLLGKYNEEKDDWLNFPDFIDIFDKDPSLLKVKNSLFQIS